MEILTNRINTPITHQPTLSNVENTETNANYLPLISPPHEIYSDEPYAISDNFNTTLTNDPINDINYSDDKYGDNYSVQGPTYEEPGKD